ncbi:MAG: DUF3568 family protein [Candidatus Omnitrophota bacterium]|nr:DUF3568 family protein [Candidatus Omnitrophota bacterium]
MSRWARCGKVFYFLIILSFCGIYGCAPLVIGGAGVLGGYAVGRDTIKGHSDKSYNAIWNSALKVAKIKGKLTKEDKEKGEIEMEAELSRVWIKLTKLTKSATEIKVSARKYSLPNLKLAEEIFIKIMEQIK